MRPVLTHLVLLAVSICLIDGLQLNQLVGKPQKLSSCHAKLDNGQEIDLSSMDDASNPRKATHSDGQNTYTYTFNPCSPIKCVSGAKYSAAVCQQLINNPTYTYNCGDQSAADFDLVSGNLQITFAASGSGSNIVRTSILTCVCADVESFTVDSTTADGKYYMTFKNKCCCPGKCSGGGGGGSSDGLSFGSILLIIFFVSLAVYFIAGVLFMKLVRKSSGKEMVPHIEFWTSLPGYVKDGMGFTKAKVTGKNYSAF